MELKNCLSMPQSPTLRSLTRRAGRVRAGTGGKEEDANWGGKAGVVTEMKVENLKYADRVTAQKITIPFAKCEKCDQNMLGGTERLEGDPFFMYNCSVAQLTPPCCDFLHQLTPPCCDFLHRLGTCLSPDTGRSLEAREKGKGTVIRTRLVFMPMPNHDTSTPLDASTEAMVCDPGQFYSLARSAVFTSKLAPARGEPAPTVSGWSGQMLVPDTRLGRRL